jgi:hypothetical protein
VKRRDFIKLGLIAAPAISMSCAARSEDAELIVGSNVGSPPFAFKDGDGYSGLNTAFHGGARYLANTDAGTARRKSPSTCGHAWPAPYNSTMPLAAIWPLA